MTKNNQFSPEVRQRATRLVFESQHEYSSQWAAICSVAQKIGCSPETLRAWIRRQEGSVAKIAALIEFASIFTSNVTHECI